MADPPVELWEQILLRLPPDDPATLLRASLVCKLWRRIFSGPGFLRRLVELHRAAPMLGFFHNHMDERGSAVGTGFAPIAASAFSLPIPERRPWSVVDCRHGRVLLLSAGRECLYDPTTGHRRLELHKRQLLVWEPTTGYQGFLPEFLPVFWGPDCNAAVMCAADGCDHCNCQGGPFRVVIIYTVREEEDDVEDLAGDLVSHMATLARVYSSETGQWINTTSLDHCSIIDQDSAPILVGNILCFRSYFENDAISWPVDIIMYDLQEHTFETIEVEDSPVFDFEMIEDEDYPFFNLVQAEDGGLGIAIVKNHSVLQLWSWDEASWVRKKTIHLDDVLPPAAALPAFAGFAEGADIVFLTTADGIYTVELKIGQARKVCGRVDLHGPLFPFITQLCSDDYMSKVRAHQLQSYPSSSSSSMFYHELEASNRHLQESLDEQLRKHEVLQRRHDALESQFDEQLRKHEVLQQRHDALESQVTFPANMLQNFVQTASSSQQQQMSFTPPFASLLPLAQQHAPFPVQWPFQFPLAWNISGSSSSAAPAQDVHLGDVAMESRTKSMMN